MANEADDVLTHRGVCDLESAGEGNRYYSWRPESIGVISGEGEEASILKSTKIASMYPDKNRGICSKYYDKKNRRNKKEKEIVTEA